MTPIFELDAVSRTFPGSPPLEALRDVSLSMDEGGYLSIAGPSGSGKTTLLNILGCLDRPTAGGYYLTGIDVGKLSDAKRTALRGQRIGFAFQAFHLLPYRSVMENVITGLLYNRVPRRERKRLALDALDRVGLSERRSYDPRRLSGGERQRVAIARALVSRPAILLCDEPTGNLDTKTGSAILDLFDELVADGLTLVVVTHDAAVSSRAGRTVEIVDGVLTEGVAA
ncbi:MAG: ABC transporter ATP-binding protein [Acidimicrobiia bacterium]|nr:ABC transporter ATP-binding protein [Acidimicrobiia bacterium]